MTSERTGHVTNYHYFSCEDPAAIEQAEVDILTNGVDVNSRWEANVFKFVNKPVVHLHCKVRICFDTDDSQCSDVQNMCGNRKRRAVDGYLPAEDKVRSNKIKIQTRSLKSKSIISLLFNIFLGTIF